MPQSSLGVIDGKKRIGMIPSCGGGVPAPYESGPEQIPAQGSIEWLVIRIEHHPRVGIDETVQLRQNPPHGCGGFRGSAPVEGLPLRPALSLQPGKPPLASQRRDLGGHQEQRRPVDEDRDTHRLVAIALERLQLVELEGAIHLPTSQAVRLEKGRMAGKPSEAMFNGAPRHPEGSGALPLAHTGHHEVEKGGVEIGLFLEVIRAKALAGKGPSAGTTAETRHRVVPAVRNIETMTQEEAGWGIPMVPTGRIGTAWRFEQEAPP